MSNTSANFDIRDFLDQLEPSKEKGKYICPVCSGKNLGIDLKSGKYTCFNGCECRDIRETLKPWSEVSKNNSTQKNKMKTKTPVKAKFIPVALPKGELAIARLSEIPTDSPQPQAPQILSKGVRAALAEKDCTPEEIEKATVTIYDYGDSKKIFRYDAPCAKKTKGREKTFAVQRTEDGKVLWSKGNYTWSAYRQTEAIAAGLAVEDSKIPVILAHEGEKCVEVGRFEKLAGISAQGTPSENDWVCILNDMKMRMGDRPFIIAHIQDNDETGKKKAQTVAKAAARSQVPFVAVDLALLVPDLCEKGDVADILGSKMTGDELAKAILEEIDRQRNEQLAENFNDEFDEEDYEEDEGPTITIDPENPESLYKNACEQLKLPFEDCVTARAFDTWAYHCIFSGAEDWRVIDSAFYKWSESEKYWQHQTDNKINTLIADAGERAFKVSEKSVGKESFYIYTRPYGTNNHTESAFKYVRKRLERPEPLPTNTHLLAFRNCVVDLRTGKQMPHSKDYFLTNVIPYDYEPGKECPEVFRQFITESFGEDMLEAIRAFTSMFLDPTAPYGRFPHLIGQSGGGKGTLGRFWSSLFGENGSSSAAMFSDLSTPEGRHQYLTSKRIFGFPDVGGYAQGVRAFYELVDNGSMTGRALFNSVAYNKQWYMRFWLASVDHLQIENAGDGWARRAFPLPVKSRNVKSDPDLRMKLEACKSDVISWALSMAREERDRILSSPPDSEHAANLALDAALYGDSTKSFVDLCLRPSADAHYVPHHQMHDWYVSYCKEHGYSALGMSKFISHLKTVLPRNFQDRYWSPTVNGQRQRIPAHWKWIAPLPNIFTSQEASAETTNQNPIWFCTKSNCAEGGLSDFENSWKPETPEPSTGAAVHPVQGTLEVKNDPGQGETLTQSGCPPCPSVHSETLDIKIENKKLATELHSPPMFQKVISEEKVGMDKMDTLDSRSQSGFQPVQGTLELKSDPGHPGQSLPEPVSTVSESKKGEAAIWENPDNLQDLANLLEYCESGEMIADLRQCYPAFALKAACDLLSPEKRNLVKKWVLEQNKLT